MSIGERPGPASRTRLSWHCRHATLPEHVRGNQLSALVRESADVQELEGGADFFRAGRVVAGGCSVALCLVQTRQELRHVGLRAAVAVAVVAGQGGGQESAGG